MLPLDQGTIILMNKVAARGPPLPKNLKIIFKGVEVEDEGGADNGDKAMQDRYDAEGLKIVSDAGSSLPDGMDLGPTVIDYGEQDIIGIHASIDTVNGPLPAVGATPKCFTSARSRGRVRRRNK
jgi:hypothetical protein